MKMPTTMLAIAAMFPPAAMAQSESGQAEEFLRSLIDPPPQEVATSNGSPTEDEMLRVVSEILESPSPSVARLLGPSAGPALRTIVERRPLSEIVAGSSEALASLIEVAPELALDYFDSLQRTEPFQYEAILRTRWGREAVTPSSFDSPAMRATYSGLLDRTLLSLTLYPDYKADLARVALERGVITEASRTFLRNNLELITDSFDFGDAWPVVDTVLPAGTEPPVDLAEGPAQLLAETRVTPEVLESLSMSPHESVRIVVAQKTWDLWESGANPDRVISIIARQLRDESPRCRSYAVSSLQEIFTTNDLSIDAQRVTTLVRSLEGGQLSSRSELASWFVQGIKSAARRTTPAEIADVEELFEAVFTSDMPVLVGALTENPPTSMPPHVALAYYEAAARHGLGEDEVTRGVLIGGRPRSGDSIRATYHLDVLSSDEVSVETARWFQREKNRRADLEALPASRVADAIVWAGTANDSFGRLIVGGAWTWRGADSAARKVAEDKSAAARSRLVAYFNLIAAGAASDADASSLAELVAEVASDPATLPDAEWFLGAAERPVDSHRSKWIFVAQALLEDERVPTQLTELLRVFPDAETEEERTAMRRIAAAVEKRRVESGGDALHLTLAYALLRDPTLVPVPLVLAWLENPNGPLHSAVDALLVLEAQSPGTAELASAPLTRRLALTSSRDQRIRVADQLLRLPGDSAIEGLLDAALRSGDSRFVTVIETRIAERIRLREARQRWSTLKSGGTDLEGATARVLALLDSDVPAVRVEAIRGLGTLGAVEALPRLIEIVGTGSEAEVAAARETLDLLHEAARRRTLETAPAESGQ